MTIVKQLLSGEVIKPTVLVHFERNLSLKAQKILTLIVFHVQVAKKRKDGFYYINKKFIRRLIGGLSENPHHDSQDIHDAFEELSRKGEIRWNFLDKDVAFKDLVCKLIISLAKPNNKGHYYAFEIHPKLEPIIKNPRVFHPQKIIMLAILINPRYAYPLYELLLDAYSRGETVLKISMFEFKKCLGIPQEAYSDNYKAFKQWVLKPCLKALKEKTDIQAGVKTYREGRKVAGLYFHIQKQSWQMPLPEELLEEIKRSYHLENDQNLFLVGQRMPIQLPSPEEQAFIESVGEYGINEQSARKALDAHGLKGCLEIRDYALTQHKKAKKDDFGAYIASCLRGGHGVRTPQERLKMEQEKLKREELRRIQEAERQAAEQEERDKEARIKACQELQAKIQALPEAERSELEKEAERRVIAKRGKGAIGIKISIKFESYDVYKEWYSNKMA